MTCRFKSLLLALLGAATLTGVSTPALAENQLPTVNLSAQGSAPALNDLARAEAYAEVTGPDVKSVAASVNKVVANALNRAKAYPTVKVRTAQTDTWPVYAQNTRNISAWRMRSTLSLESNDVAALSALVGVLQSNMAIGNLRVEPAADTLARAQDEATLAALAAFQARAALVAKALNSPYRIKSIDIGMNMPAPMFRARMAADQAMAATAAPVEAGQSDITIQVSGTIELTQ
jgi:predicted secreted protein